MTSLIVGTACVVLVAAMLALGLHGRRNVCKPVTTAARYDALNDRLRAVHEQSTARTGDLRGDIEALRERRDGDERLQRQADDLDRITEIRKRTGGRS